MQLENGSLDPRRRIAEHPFEGLLSGIVSHPYRPFHKLEAGEIREARRNARAGIGMI